MHEARMKILDVCGDVAGELVEGGGGGGILIPPLLRTLPHVLHASTHVLVQHRSEGKKNPRHKILMKK